MPSFLEKIMVMICHNEFINIDGLYHKIINPSIFFSKQTVIIELYDNVELVEQIFAVLTNNEYIFEYPTYLDKHQQILKYLIDNKLCIIYNKEKITTMTVLLINGQDNNKNIDMSPETYFLRLTDKALLEAL